jgi:hypothetical protein
MMASLLLNGESIMKKRILTILLATTAAISFASYAEGPDKAGKGKSHPEKQVEVMDDDEKGDHGDKVKEQERRRERQDDPQGLEKQREKKSEQVQKELGHGSEQGQESREQHRKKWWKFWGDE